MTGVRFSGEINGFFYVSVNESLAKKITCRLLGLTSGEIERKGIETANDAMCELTNIIGGNFKNKLYELGYSPTLSIPCIFNKHFNPTDYTFKQFTYTYAILDEICTIQLFLESKQKSLKILSIDDSKTICAILKRIFQPYDVEFMEANNGIEGLKMAKKHLPDLILLDVTMPEMNGIEMLTQLKKDEKTKNLPVVMLTAEANRESILKIAKIGIRDYILKPFQEDTIVTKVGKIVELKALQ